MFCNSSVVMADLLHSDIVRQFNLNKRDVTETNKQLIFGECSYLKNLKTNYMVDGLQSWGK